MNDEMLQMEFGKRIAECRRERQFTQEELADRVGITPQTLSQYERGRRYPDVTILRSLCGILDISADYLLGIERRKITEDDNSRIQDEIWRNLRTSLDTLKIVIGKDIVPAFLDGSFVEEISRLRVLLSKEGVLMPIVRIQDWQNVKSREFMILAYDTVIYQEIIPDDREIKMETILSGLETAVRKHYDTILNVDMIKDLTDNLRINHCALIDGVVPEKISYGLLTDVCRAFVRRGNTLTYLPKIIELLEIMCRTGSQKSAEEIAEYAAQQIGTKENVWIWLHDRDGREQELSN